MTRKLLPTSKKWTNGTKGLPTLEEEHASDESNSPPSIKHLEINDEEEPK